MAKTTEPRIAKYVCRQCEAEDSDTALTDLKPPAALNCWKRHAGQNINLATMIGSETGMFPVAEKALPVN